MRVGLECKIICTEKLHRTVKDKNHPQGYSFLQQGEKEIELVVLIKDVQIVSSETNKPEVEIEFENGTKIKGFLIQFNEHWQNWG